MIEVELPHGKKAMDREILDGRSFISEGSKISGEVIERERRIVHELDYECFKKIDKLRGETLRGFRVDREYAIIAELLRYECLIRNRIEK